MKLSGKLEIEDTDEGDSVTFELSKNVRSGHDMGELAKALGVVLDAITHNCRATITFNNWETE